MSKKMNMRATGLVLGVVALLLLAACSGAVSTEQVSEQSPSATVASIAIADASSSLVASTSISKNNLTCTVYVFIVIRPLT